MALAKGSVNPLNVLGVRRLSFIPSHFAKMHVNNGASVQKIEHWIYTNLNSRYSICKRHKVIEEKITEVSLIGIEDPQEITMLILACPYFNN
jgi:hypothetical protein